MTPRLQLAQRRTRILLCALEKDSSEAMTHLVAVEALESNPPAPASCATQYWPWDQSIGSGVAEVRRALRCVTSDAIRFTVMSIGTNTTALTAPPSSSSSSSSNGSATSLASRPAGFTSVNEVTNGSIKAVTSLFALRAALSQSTLYLDKNASSEIIVSPDWLRSVTAFVRTVGMELPLLLQVAASTLSLSAFQKRSPAATVDEITERVGAMKIENADSGVDVLARHIEAVAESLLGIFGKTYYYYLLIFFF